MDTLRAIGLITLGIGYIAIFFYMLHRENVRFDEWEQETGNKIIDRTHFIDKGDMVYKRRKYKVIVRDKDGKQRTAIFRVVGFLSPQFEITWDPPKDA